MLTARTAWAIALLLAPTGAAVAGMTATVPAQHTAYVEITIEEDQPTEGLAGIEAYVTCQQDGHVQQALEWLGQAADCAAPAGAAIYVTNARAPSPAEAGVMIPTGTVYAYEDADRVWMVPEYTYEGPDDRHHAYVLSPDISDRVEGDLPGEPVRGVVDLDKLGIPPGGQGNLATTLAAGPRSSPQDPSLERVDASTTPSLTWAGLTG